MAEVRLGQETREDSGSRTKSRCVSSHAASGRRYRFGTQQGRKEGMKEFLKKDKEKKRRGRKRRSTVGKWDQVQTREDEVMEEENVGERKEVDEKEEWE